MSRKPYFKTRAEWRLKLSRASTCVLHRVSTTSPTNKGMRDGLVGSAWIIQVIDSRRLEAMMLCHTRELCSRGVDETCL